MIGQGLPHARGGVSGFAPHDLIGLKSSPRPWGCFQLDHESSESLLVFPTPVGVFLPEKCAVDVIKRLPHARGGVSRFEMWEYHGQLSSPRPWGCFLGAYQSAACTPVFPTPVGVFPTLPCVQADTVGLPHARGGVSQFDFGILVAPGSSPRPWGCFYVKDQTEAVVMVFPTPVGVFL